MRTASGPRRRGASRRRLPLPAALLLGVACVSGGQTTTLQTQAILSVSTFNLMQCQECISGELAAVAARGNDAVPELRGLLLSGPPGSFIAQVGARLRMPVDTGGAAFIPPEAAVASLLDDYRTIYRVRSSRALGSIGGAEARQALCAGKAQNFSRPEVRAAIDSALAAMGGTCP